MKRFRKSAIALVLALLMALQGTEPIFVQAKEAIEDVQKNADFLVFDVGKWMIFYSMGHFVIICDLCY